MVFVPNPPRINHVALESWMAHRARTIVLHENRVESGPADEMRMKF